MKITSIDFNGFSCVSNNCLSSASNVVAIIKSIDGNTNLYFVMASSSGDLFNPTSHDIYKKDRERGLSFWNLTKCSKNCFDKYVEFLEIKNPTSLLVAQRRLRNDWV